jgi:hypothetical protein
MFSIDVIVCSERAALFVPLSPTSGRQRRAPAFDNRLNDFPLFSLSLVSANSIVFTTDHDLPLLSGAPHWRGHNLLELITRDPSSEGFSVSELRRAFQLFNGFSG